MKVINDGEPQALKQTGLLIAMNILWVGLVGKKGTLCDTTQLLMPIG